MKLTELDPEWVNYAAAGRHRFADLHSAIDYGDGEAACPPIEAEDIAHADGVLFLCPACFANNKGERGTESVLCWFADRLHIPADATPGPGRWTATGTSFADLTLSPSVNVDHEHWHGWIKNGEVT